MAKTKAATTQRLSREDKLKILKRAKIYSGSTKITDGKASGAQKRALAYYRDEIPLLASGKAKAVSIGKTKRKDIASGYKPGRGRIIVHVEQGETPRYNKKTGKVTAIVVSHGVKYRRIVNVKPYSTVDDLPKGKNYRYLVPFRQWGIADSPLFSDPQELARFMAGYEKSYANWIDAVEVLELLKKSDAPDEELDDA